ncbi:SDR family NAD(P)-dependent oxidoreductase [Halomicrobium salinisoli]|uniref:SDR family NAD(P)-dependent oxidoreductase n=1 Tax=Halomicrobium salinisoli TaxID=2878391 RepID=UPI001CEFB816|nr:SDR family oxidoreductase [Halomicrobium salinisoli]
MSDSANGSLTGPALITGASAGIGRSLAREFARHHHDVVLVARREERLRDLADGLERPGVAATAVPMDLAADGAPEWLWNELDERGLEPDVLVNNVGVGTHGRFAESDLDRERAQLRLNVELPVELTRRFLDGRDRGAVLNVGSVAGFTPGPFMAGYYASKAYVNSFSEALAAEHRDDGVRVTVVCPGPVDTEFHDRAGVEHSSIGRWLSYDPDFVARAAYDGLRRDETVVIPGRGMAVLSALLRVVPRSLRRLGGRLINGGR